MFYVEDSLEKGWHVGIEKAPRNLYNMSEKDSEAYDEVIYGLNESYNIRDDEDDTYDRSEIPESMIDSEVNHNILRRE